MKELVPEDYNKPVNKYFMDLPFQKVVTGKLILSGSCSIIG